ncbi:hypothetical protein KY314_01900 [Candidatus Woesearchaeota archaeon]|nr:hypothetical protein [Candidatus Woesearchaeota archaeon]
MAIDENSSVMKFIKETLEKTKEMSFSGKKDLYSKNYIIDSIIKQTKDGKFFYKEFRDIYRQFRKDGLI